MTAGSDDITPAFRDKTAEEQVKLARNIFDAATSGRFSATKRETDTLVEFIVHAQRRQTVGRALLRDVSKIVRQYEQYLIALTSWR